MPTIALDTVKSLANYLTAQGLDRPLILDCIQLSEAELNQSRQLIDAQHYESLFRLAEQQLGRNTIGFEFGQTIEADRWGILGYIAFTSASFREASSKQQKYQSLVGDVGTPVQELLSDGLLLKWLPAYRCSHNLVEEIITGWMAMALKLSLGRARPKTIYFTHACQSDLDRYQAYFACELKFNSEFNGIKIDEAMLDVPLAKHDPEINSLLCQHADTLMNQLTEQQPLKVLQRFIHGQLPMGVPELEDAAQNLQMSVRTLQRKLNEHQLTFTGLVENIRKEQATRYLRDTDVKIVHIAQMLGFSEQSAFQRAFKRWTHKTPKQFRDQL